MDRSLCSVVCKWTYQADQTGRSEWSDSFWEEIGLGDLKENNYAKIGKDFSLQIFSTISKMLQPSEMKFFSGKFYCI